jgi:hypothetical protein
MSKNTHPDMQSRQAFDSNRDASDFNFDRWAVAVRRQMLAALKKREASRSNWG